MLITGHIIANIFWAARGFCKKLWRMGKKGEGQWRLKWSRIRYFCGCRGEIRALQKFKKWCKKFKKAAPRADLLAKQTKTTQGSWAAWWIGGPADVLSTEKYKRLKRLKKEQKPAKKQSNLP